MASIAVVCLGPARHLGLPRLHQRSRLVGRLRRLEPPLASCQGLRGFGQFLLRVSPALANGQRITLHDLMGDMEEIRHAQAFQALFRKLDEGLGAVTDYIQHPGAQAREPFPDQRLPRGIGPIVCHLFQQEIARRKLHQTRSMRSESFIHRANHLAHRSARTPLLLPRRGRL